MTPKFFILISILTVSCDPETGFLGSASKISKRGDVPERSSGDVSIISDIAISGLGEAEQSERVQFELLYNEKYSNSQKEESSVEWQIKTKPGKNAFVQKMVSDKNVAIYYFDDAGEYLVEVSVKFDEDVVKAEHKIKISPFVVEKPNVAPTIQLTGSSRAIVAGETIAFSAKIQDDNFAKLPPLTYGWTVESGDKEAVSFSNSNELDTEITVSAAGEYRIRVTADDHQFKEFKEFNFTAYSKRITAEDGYRVATTFSRSNNDSWSCGLDSKGVFCFGSRAPALPTDIIKPKKLVIGENHACILDEDTPEGASEAILSIKCWGSASPATVPNDLGAIKDLDAGMQNTCTIHTIEVDNVDKPIYELDEEGNPVLDADGNPVQATDESGNLIFEQKNFDDFRCWGATTESSFSPTFKTSIADAEIKSNVAVGNTSQVCFTDETNHKIVCNDSTVATGLYLLGAEETVQRLVLGYASVCAIIENADNTKKVECWGDTNYALKSVPTDKGEVVDLATGQYFSCGIFKLENKNSLECWGSDIYSTGNSQPTNLENPVQVSISIDRACVVDSFAAQCWGQDRNGSNAIPATVDFGIMDIGANEQLRRTVFKDVIKDNFSRNCGNGGCHTNDGWSFDYFAAKSTAPKILERMNLPAGNALRMPRGRNWASAQDEQDVRDWLDLILN